MHWVRLAAAMMALAAGAGCSHGVGRGAGMTELNEASAGRSVTVAMGERIRVTLRETASTGFRWSAGTGCGNLLHLEEERAVSPGDARPGASGKRVWLYTATGEGTCELRFVSARSWEKAGSGTAISFPVTVGERK